MRKIEKLIKDYSEEIDVSFKLGDKKYKIQPGIDGFYGVKAVIKKYGLDSETISFATLDDATRLEFIKTVIKCALPEHYNAIMLKPTATIIEIFGLCSEWFLLESKSLSQGSDENPT